MEGVVETEVPASGSSSHEGDVQVRLTAWGESRGLGVVVKKRVPQVEWSRVVRILECSFPTCH